jgi:hypothetical protein
MSRPGVGDLTVNIEAEYHEVIAFPLAETSDHHCFDC